ncbi:YadA-like family protein [uncultured Megasphaera sp.]|uniref:YadA-like family protein n=1 Tax=uncultured Megasphaera sp. TaxID=165188 RepID=UPI0025971670|nr:YadA-like family protein [uncultured Megasphaera sp.]
MNGHNGGAIAIGHLSYSNGNQDVAIGDNAKTDRHGTEGEGYVAIGANSFSNVGPGVVGYGYDFHDFQTKGSQTNEYAAVWKSTNGAVSVGNVSDSDHTKWITRQITGVAAGSADTDAVNVAQLKAAISSVNTDSSSSTSGDGVHYYSVLSDEKGSGSNYDNQGAKGKNSLAAGVRASTAENAENAVAIGYKAKADGVGATVIGQYGTASGRYALAFGGQQTDNTAPAANNQAIGDNSVAFGERSKASGSNSTAFGQATQALEERATAFGQRTTAKQSNATAFGQDTVADGQNATAFGERTEARGESATAFGSDSIASGKDSLAFGTGSKASGNNSLAGLGGTATTANSIALGNNTKANNKDNAVSVAIGENAEASGERSLAIGFGVSEKVNGQDDTTLTSTKASGESAIAIGTDVVAKGQHSVAMGSHTDAAKDSSVAIGFDTHTVSDSAVAIGSGTRAEGRYSVALGLSSVAGKETNDETNPLNGGGSVAIGYGTSAKASRSIAIGTGATAANADFTTALGDSANAQQRGSIAIGAGSVATRAAGNKEGGTAYKEAYLIPDVSKATDAEKAIWTSTEGAVSVGGTAKYQEYDENGKKVTKTKPLTRQITNVAAGSEDTDAVNVAQLKQAGFTVTANTDAATGSNIKMGNTLDFKAEDNAIVSTTKDSKTITVKVSKTPTFDSVTTGDTVINNAGLTVGGKTYVSNAGLNANNKVITNVANGKADNDAVNVSQLKDSRTMVTSSDQSIQVADTANGNPNHAYDIKVDYGKVADNTSISYKANGGTAQSVTLKNGLNFTNGANTTAEVGADGVVKVNATDMRVQSGTATYSDDGNGSISMTHHDGTTATISGLKDTYTRSASYDAANKKATFTRNDNTTYDLDLSAIANEAGNGKLNFKGDDETVIARKLNEQLDIVGGADAKKLTDKNIGVNNVGGQLKIQLAKDIDLTKSGSVKMGDTTINNTGLTIHGGPSITQTHIDAGSKTIINVAPGENGTDAVNVKQLNEVKNVASAHSTVSVGGQKAQKDGKEVKGGNLILTRTQDADTHAYNYDVKLGNDITVGEKGEPGKNGVDGKIGVNGKNGSSVVINGKDGTIGLNGKNGTNGLTIRGAAGKDGITRIVYKDAAGKDHPVATLDDGLKFKGDTGDVISKKLNQRMDIVGGANKNNLSENNIGVISDNGKLHVKPAKDLKGLTSVTTTDGNGNTTVQNGKGVTVKDSQNNTSIFTAKDITFTNRDKSHKTKLDEDGLIIFTKGTSGQANQTIKITNTYISMGGQQIHNVLAGKADTDAVNVSQLKAVQSVAEAHSTVSVGGKKAGKDSVDVKGGNLVLKRTENTNGSKNYDVKLADDISIKSVKTTDDKGNKTVQKGGGITTIDKDGNKTSVTGKGVTTVDKEGNKTSLTGKGMTTVDKEGNKTSVTGKGVSISSKDGNKTTITENGLTIKGGPVVTKDKFSAGGQQIHDVEAGTAPKDAVNVSQLNDEIGKVEQHHTEVTVNGGTEAQEGTYNPSGNLQIKKTTDKDTGKKTYDLKLADNLTFGAKDGADGKEGVDGSIGVNGRNGSAVVINGQDGSIGLNGADGKNGLTIKGANGTVGVDGQAGTTRLIYETKDGETTVKHEVATMDDGMKYSGDSGNAAVKLNKNVQVYGGATEYADGNNIGVVASQDGDNAKLQVKLAKDLKGINSIEAKTITTGNTTMDNGGLTVKTGDDSHDAITIKQGNVNMGGNKIEGVAPGKVSQDSTDAVNGSQLWQRDQAINGLSGSVNKLGNRINRVGAGAAALAALHPLDFDPDDKWDFAAGYGNYRGANAAAVGAYYRPNEDTMFSVGGSFGGGENMVNAGVSIKLGQGNHVSTSRVAMAKEIKDLRQNVANLNAIVNRQSALIDKLTGTNAGMIKDKGNDLFPDVPANHWAYEYVTKLKHAGILTGYPDGNFDGDRMMTRYEFAAIVYRAIMAGAASNPALNQDGTLDKLANEFSSEMKYIRIDTIAKDKNGKPTIERVRVISDAK